MKKKGFTLSEVLIALTVLGILAAILIPTVMKATPKQNKALLKKAHYVLTQSIHDLINDETNYPSGSQVYNNSGVLQSACTISSVAVNCDFNNIYVYNTTTPTTVDKFCYLLANSMETVGAVTYSTPGGAPGTFTTADGIYWTVYSPSPEFPLDNTAYTTLVTVDVNGPSKGPGCSPVAITNPTASACATGTIPDIFQFGIRYDGKVSVSSDSITQAILTNPTDNR